MSRVIHMRADEVPDELLELAGLPARAGGRRKPDYEGEFAYQCRQFQLPEPRTQYRFAAGESPPRQWRFDFAWPQFRLAVEIEGLVVRTVWEAKLEGTRPVRELRYISNVTDVKRLVVAMGGHATPTGLREDCEKYNTAALLGWTVLRFEQRDIKPRHAIAFTMRVLASRGWQS